MTTIPNEHIGDRLAIAFGEAREAALASFGDAAEAQYDAAIATAIAWTAGLRDGLPGVRRARTELRAAYVAGRVGGAEGDLGAARAERARKAWSRHEARLNMALVALDRRHNPALKNHSATRAIHSAYQISQASSLGFAALRKLFRDVFAEIGIVDGISYAELTRTETEKVETGFDAEAEVAKIVKSLDKKHASPAQFRAVITGLRAALAASEEADAAMRERIADAAMAAQAADDDGADAAQSA